MLERLESPDTVLAFRAVGKIDAVDYERVLQPAVQEMVDTLGELRLVYVLGDEFDGYTAGAGWEDAKLGIPNLSKWKRCAVVTNHEWVEHLIGIFGWLMPGEIKAFTLEEVQAAIAWAAA
jgi:SpoIIAA-like